MEEVALPQVRGLEEQALASLGIHRRVAQPPHELSTPTAHLGPLFSSGSPRNGSIEAKDNTQSDCLITLGSDSSMSHLHPRSFKGREPIPHQYAPHLTQGPDSGASMSKH